jgi:dimethylamine/trimethylamine dehydrogenase|tara:strand:- start:424 stop:594 length:171 start_codon:yes stop_codon:yes gene_type:complete
VRQRDPGHFAPRLIYNTIFDGHRLAREFESENPERPLPYIRERRIWGDDTMPTLNR